MRRKITRILICLAILLAVFMVATFITSLILEAIHNKRYAPGDNDRKYESIGDSITLLFTGIIAMLTIGTSIVIWKIRNWNKKK